MGNPFLGDFLELVTFDSCNCADESVVATVCTLDDTGKKQYRDCDKNVLDERMAQSRRILYRSLQILNTRQRGSTLWPIVRLYAEPRW